MTLLEILEESITVLKTNRLRTALSALGIIIGIASVITLMSLGQGSQKSIQERIQRLGSNLLTIRPGSAQQGFLGGGGGSATTLVNEDSDTIKTTKRISTIEKVASDYTSRTQASYSRNNTNAQVSGVSPEYFEVRDITLTIGSEITEENDKNLDKVAVLGSEIKLELFGENLPAQAGTVPVGQNIRINGVSFRVIGVAESKGGGFNSPDDLILIPLSTAQKVLFGTDRLSNIYVVVKDSDSMDATLNQLGFLLLERHNLKSPDEADFTIQSQEDILETVNEVTNTFTMLLTGIAAISLIVGGIGIMNIMLVTVTERTREIGLRKAIGAKRKTVIYQFLVESIVLTLVGGMIGVLIGLILTYVLSQIMNIPLVISAKSLGLAVGVSCVIGILFGWYPAWKASKLQPIEALRYE